MGNRLKTIGRLDASREWQDAGYLKYARHGHAVIYNKDSFFVFGGNGSLMSEKCTLIDEKFTCYEQEPQLEAYGFYPELALVSENFGD